MDIGYARVSTEGQDHQTQVQALEEKGCGKVFAEKVSGKDRNGRPQLEALIEFAREGDTVHVMKLDRLARNTIDALEIAKQLQGKGVGLKVYDIGGMDITSPAGELVYSVLASVAQMERRRLRERQREGIDLAKAQGRHLGRREALTDDQKREALKQVSQGLPKAQVAKALGVSRTTLYKVLAEAG